MRNKRFQGGLSGLIALLLVMAPAASFADDEVTPTGSEAEIRAQLDAVRGQIAAQEQAQNGNNNNGGGASGALDSAMANPQGGSNNQSNATQPNASNPVLDKLKDTAADLISQLIASLLDSLLNGGDDDNGGTMDEIENLEDERDDLDGTGDTGTDPIDDGGGLDGGTGDDGTGDTGTGDTGTGDTGTGDTGTGDTGTGDTGTGDTGTGDTGTGDTGTGDNGTGDNGTGDNGDGGFGDPIDTDGDGTPDGFDRDGDGQPDTFDTDGDGRPDAFDRDGDGKPDAFDRDGDGRPDVFDDDGDGNPDTVVTGNGGGAGTTGGAGDSDGFAKFKEGEEGEGGLPGDGTNGENGANGGVAGANGGPGGVGGAGSESGEGLAKPIASVTGRVILLPKIESEDLGLAGEAEEGDGEDELLEELEESDESTQVDVEKQTEKILDDVIRIETVLENWRKRSKAAAGEGDVQALEQENRDELPRTTAGELDYSKIQIWVISEWTKTEPKRYMVTFPLTSDFKPKAGAKVVIKGAVEKVKLPQDVLDEIGGTVEVLEFDSVVASSNEKKSSEKALEDLGDVDSTDSLEDLRKG